jgi:hypothetical protein
MCAASAWFGFAIQCDKRRIDAFIQHGKRSGLYPIDVQTFTELGQAADDKLFRTVLPYSHRVLYSLLPEKSNMCITTICKLDFMIGFYLIALINL